MGKAKIRPKILLPVWCLCVAWCGGCFTKKNPKAHMTGIVLAHPVVPSAAAEESPGDAPDIALEAGEMSLRLATPRSGPAKPRVPPTPPAEPPPVEKTVEPLISPDLTPEQLNAAQTETQQSLDAAESKLSQSHGKKLNATQEDVASKVRGFMDSAKEAIKTGDWVRAKNQAKKAEVLAQQLTGNP
jgi:hypothetical protein